MKKVYTIGCDRVKSHVFWSILNENHISHLVDIRRFNSHFSSMFNKERLQTLCQDSGITYVHAPELAPSKSLLSYARREEKENEKRYPWPDKKQHQEDPHLLKYISDQRCSARLHYYFGPFKENYLKEIQDGKGLALLIKLIEGASKPCFLAKNKFTKLNVCYRKMLMDHLVTKFTDRYKVIHLIDTFYHQGKTHNLRSCFQHVNQVYFNNEFTTSEVAFTWASCLPATDRKVCCGFFKHPNLVLINEILDSPEVPEFFINGVLYHELIHYRRFRQGLDSDHSVDFYLKELDFIEAGKKFHVKREWFEKFFPAIKQEIEISKIPRNEYERKLELLRKHLEKMMKQRVKEGDEHA